MGSTVSLVGDKDEGEGEIEGEIDSDLEGMIEDKLVKNRPCTHNGIILSCN